MKDTKTHTTGAKKLREKELPAPYLETLDSATWERFLGEFHHYKSLGGRRKWPTLCSAAALRLIAIISKVPNFTTVKNRALAKKRVSAIYKGSSPQSISDQLKDTLMAAELSLDAISEYITAFDAKRSVDPAALEKKTFVNSFISGLFPSRLRVRVRTAVGPDSIDLEEAIRQSLSHGGTLTQILKEGSLVQHQIEAEKSRRERSLGITEKKSSVSKPPHKKEFGGKRRFTSSSTGKNKQNTNPRSDKLHQRQPIKKPSFLKGVFCRKCKKEGHKVFNCPLESKGDSRYLCELSSAFSSSAPYVLATLKNSDGLLVTVPCLLDTGATSSVISMDMIDKLAVNVSKSDIPNITLADGSEIPVLGSADIEIILPGVDGSSLRFTEQCLIIKMHNKKQAELIVGKDRVLHDSLLDWVQDSNMEESCLLEDDLGLDVVSPFDSDEGNWTCEVPELRASITILLDAYLEKINKSEPAKTSDFELEFPKGGKPIFSKVRRIPFHLQTEVKNQLDELQKSEFIIPSKSDFAAPIVLAPKPNGGLRLCCDYTRLNRATPSDLYPLPRQDTLFAALAGKKYFGALDLKNGYFNIKVSEKTRPLTAFITPWGLFEWNRMPFGLKSAPAHFQRCINGIFKDLMPHFCLVYLDDILVFGENQDDFINNLSKVLDRLSEFNLCLNLDKCKIGMKNVRYLGFIISEQGRSIDPKRLENMRNIRPPENLKEVQSLVGKLNFLREFIPDYSRTAEPLTRVMKKGYTKSCWGPEQSSAWESLLSSLDKKLSLEHPTQEGTFILRTDASTVGIGGILLQRATSGKEKLINLFSRKFNKTETRWSTIEQEAFGIYYGIMSNRFYLLGKAFQVETDHRNLQYIFKSEVPKLVRWRMMMAPFTYHIKHIPGSENQTADFLSRIELKDDYPSKTRKISTLKALDTTTKDPEKDVLLKQIHLELGHASAGLVVKVLRDRGINWTGMYKDAERVLKPCIFCKKTQKGRRIKTNGHLKTSYVFEEVSVDTVGPLPTDEEGYKHLLVAIDGFSRFTVIIPLKTLTADEIARALFINIFAVFGAPTSLRSDGGFTSAVVKELCRLCKTKMIVTLPYNHEENGLVERQNREIRRLIRLYFLERDVRFYTEEAAAMVAVLNSRIHGSTGYSPFSAVFGSKRRLTTIPPEPHADFTSDKKQIERLDSSLELIHKCISENQEVTHQKRDKQNGEEESFNVGEKVLVVPAKTPRKHLPVLSGPFVIKEKLAGSKFLLTPLNGGQDRTIPLRRLKKCDTSAPLEVLKKVAARDDDEYVVAFIVRHRFGVKKPIEFRLRWLDYDESEDTWASFDEVKDLDKLDTYLESKPNLKRKME
ncbi:Transposon Tf2-6 polyprotein, partial [Aduncisulcus paluster]